MARIPSTTIKRLAVYYRLLENLIARQRQIVSSSELVGLAGISSDQIRKDLAYFGNFGRRGAGYEAVFLSETGGLRGERTFLLKLSRF